MSIPNNFIEDWSQGFRSSVWITSDHWGFQDEDNHNLWPSLSNGAPKMVTVNNKHYHRFDTSSCGIVGGNGPGSYQVGQLFPEFVIGTDASFDISIKFVVRDPIPGYGSVNTAYTSWDAIVLYQGERKYFGIYLCADGNIYAQLGENSPNPKNFAAYAINTQEIGCPGVILNHEYELKIVYDEVVGATWYYLDGIQFAYRRSEYQSGGLIGADQTLDKLPNGSPWNGPLSLWITYFHPYPNYLNSTAAFDIGTIEINRYSPSRVVMGAFDNIPWHISPSWLPTIYNGTTDVHYERNSLIDYQEGTGKSGGITCPWFDDQQNPTWVKSYDTSGMPVGNNSDFNTPGVLWTIDNFPHLYLPSDCFQWDKLVLYGIQRNGWIKVQVKNSAGVLISDDDIPGNSVGFFPDHQEIPTIINIGNCPTEFRISITGQYDGSEVAFRTPAVLCGFQVTALLNFMNDNNTDIFVNSLPEINSKTDTGAIFKYSTQAV